MTMTEFPEGLDTFNYPNPLDPILAADAQLQVSAISAIEVALGTMPFGPYATVAAALAAKPNVNYAVATAYDAGFQVSISPAPTLAAGLCVRFKAPSTNPSPTSLVVNDDGAPIKKQGGVDLQVGDIVANQVVEAVFDGTYFWLTSPASLITPSEITGFSSAVESTRLDQLAAPAASVNFNGQQITGVGSAAAAADAVSVAVLQTSATQFAVGGGTSNTYTATLSPAPPALVAGLLLYVQIPSGQTNTGAATLNVNGLGATPIVMQDGSALAAGALTAGGVYALLFDGTNFQIL